MKKIIWAAISFASSLITIILILLLLTAYYQNGSNLDALEKRIDGVQEFQSEIARSVTKALEAIK